MASPVMPTWRSRAPTARIARSPSARSRSTAGRDRTAPSRSSGPPRPRWSAAVGLRLPEGDLATVRGRNDAAPALRPLARAEEHLTAQALGPVGCRAEVTDLDVGEPERLVGGALDDPSPDPVAYPQREIRAVAGVDALGPPAEELCVEIHRAAQIAGVQLEVDHGIGVGRAHSLPFRPTAGRRFIAADEFRRRAPSSLHRTDDPESDRVNGAGEGAPRDRQGGQ